MRVLGHRAAAALPPFAPEDWTDVRPVDDDAAGQAARAYARAHFRDVGDLVPGFLSWAAYSSWSTLHGRRRKLRRDL